MDIDANDAHELARKLAELDLTDGERAALDAVFAAAAGDDDVSGFARREAPSGLFMDGYLNGIGNVMGTPFIGIEKGGVIPQRAQPLIGDDIGA